MLCLNATIMLRSFLVVFILITLTTMAQEKKTIKYLALGDSYTIGESVSETERWPNQLAKVLGDRGYIIEKPRIIATTGWRTDNLKNAMNIAQLKPEYSLVSLLIGVNNQYQHKPVDQFAVEFEDLLNTAIQLAGGKKENVFVVSIPDYGYTPFGKPKQAEISKALDEFNNVSQKITERLNVKYIYITDISRDGLTKPELVAADNLHPSGKMYTLWVERIASQLALR
jgi:lysophospholipase L1-like esterase